MKEELDLFRDALLLRYYDIAHNKMDRIRPTLGNEMNIIVSQMKCVPLLLRSESCREKLCENGEFVGKLLGDAYCHYAPLCPNTSKNLKKLIGAKTKGDLEKNLIIIELTRFIKNSRLGIFEIHDFKNNVLIIRMEECAECSGLPILEEPVCYFTLGLFSGFFKKLFNKKIESHESKCKGKGEEFCEISLKMLGTLL